MPVAFCAEWGNSGCTHKDGYVQYQPHPAPHLRLTFTSSVGGLLAAEFLALPNASISLVRLLSLTHSLTLTHIHVAHTHIHDLPKGHTHHTTASLKSLNACLSIDALYIYLTINAMRTEVDQPPARHLRPGKKLVTLQDQGVCVLHGAPQPREGGVHLPTGRACAQPLHRVSRESENTYFYVYFEEEGACALIILNSKLIACCVYSLTGIKYDNELSCSMGWRIIYVCQRAHKRLT